MRKGILAASLAVAVMASAVMAEEGKTNSITTNPLGMIFGVYNLEYQRHLADKHAVGASFSFWKPKLLDLSNIGADISYNFYSKGGFEGLWIRPAVALGVTKWKWDETIVDWNDDFTDYTSSTIEVDESVFTFGAGATIGYKWTWEKGFTMGVAGGLQFVAGDFVGIDFGGVGPALRYDLGFAF